MVKYLLFSLPHATVCFAVFGINIQSLFGIFNGLFMISLLTVCGSTSLKRVSIWFHYSRRVPNLPVSVKDSVVRVKGNGLRIEFDSFWVVAFSNLTITHHFLHFCFLLIFFTHCGFLSYKKGYFTYFLFVVTGTLFIHTSTLSRLIILVLHSTKRTTYLQQEH